MKGNIVIFGLKVFKGKTLTGKCKRVALMMGAIVVMHLSTLDEHLGDREGISL